MARGIVFLFLLTIMMSVVLSLIAVPSYFLFRPEICSAWRWGMPGRLVNAFVSPLSYEETSVTEPPLSGLCSAGHLRDLGRRLEDVEWYRISLGSRDSEERDTYSVALQAWTPPDTGWTLISSQPSASGGIAVARVRDVSDGFGWQFPIRPGSRFVVTLCAERVRARTQSSFANSLRRHVVVKD